MVGPDAGERTGVMVGVLKGGRREEDVRHSFLGERECE